MNDKSQDDYLFDKHGTPDPDVARLEQQLGGFGRTAGAGLPDVEGVPQAGAAPLRPVTWHRTLGRTLAAAALLCVGLSLWHWYAEPHDGEVGPGRYRYEPLAGGAVLERLDGKGPGVPLPVAKLHGGSRDVPLGHRVVTEADGRGRLVVGDIGSVVLEEASRLRVEPANSLPGDDAEYALYLERGSMQASIFAAPRLFQVGTPAGIAVDMGCIYRTTVDDEGHVWLAVELGQVSFETATSTGVRQVLVPEGASCRAWPGRGAGTPVWDDAPADYRAAVEALDTFVAADPDTLDERSLKIVIGQARPKDTLTLWHLLGHDNRFVQSMAFNRLATFAPPPAGVTRAGIAAHDPTMRNTWRKSLGWSW